MCVDNKLLGKRVSGGGRGAWFVAHIGRTIVGVAGSKDAASLASKAAIGRGWRCHKIINK